MMSECTDAEVTDWQYFQWLYSMIGPMSDNNPGHTHFILAEQLHKRIFQWSVPNDDNRAVDGIFLRDEFCDFIGKRGDVVRHDLKCSMLEMLIALARRVAFESDDLSNNPFAVAEWFWRMLDNLDIKKYTDSLYFEDEATEVVNDAISNVIYRRYGCDGKGGLFPLEHPHADQRKIELGYQMSAYILENSDIGR